MATAYVKNDALSIYSEPNVDSVITKIERSGQTEAHFLSGFSEGDSLGVLTGEEEDGFVQVEYKFDIRRKISSTKKWLWILPPAGLIGTQLSQWTKETEKIWVLAEDITDDKPQTDEEIAAAKKEAAQAKLLAEVDKTIAGSGAPESETKTNNTVLIAAIAAAVAVLGGVLWWAFGKKKDEAPAAAQQPTIIQLPKQKR